MLKLKRIDLHPSNDAGALLKSHTDNSKKDISLTLLLMEWAGRGASLGL